MDVRIGTDGTARHRASPVRQDRTGVGLAGSIDPAGTTVFRTLQGRLSHDFGFWRRFGLKLTGDLSKVTSHYNDIMWFPPSVIYPDGAVMDATGKQLSAKAQLRGTYSGFKWHDLTAGIGIEQSRYKLGDATLNYAITDQGIVPAVPGSVEPDRLNVRFSRRILSAYLQDEWLLAPGGA